MSRIRSSPVAGSVATLSATATVTKHNDRYRAHVQIRTTHGSGERALEHASCAVLAESVALVIALSAADHAASETLAPLSFGLSMHAAAIIGTLPRPALGAGMEVAIEGLWGLRVDFGASMFLAQAEEFPVAPGIGARFEMQRLAGRLCRVFLVGAIDLGPCLGAQLSQISANGFGGAERASGGSFQFSPTLGLFARLPLWRVWTLRITVEAARPLERRRYIYTDLGLLHRPDAFAGQLFIAPEVLF